jgi:serine protease Do
MPDKKLKKGLIYFSLFILIIVFATGYSDDVKGDINNMFSGFFDSRFSTDRKIEEIFNNRIVEEESTIIDVVEEVSPAVVSVVVKTVGFDVFSGPFSSEDGIGTGFIVDENGIIITNSHVVDDPNGEYSVVLKDGQTYEVDTIHLDRLTDLAILEISARNLPTVELGNSDNLKVGQVAIAIGNALGRYQNTVTVGVISGISRDVTAVSGPLGRGSKTYESIIQTDAALNPGNSGGPLLNSEGQVVGINVAVGRGAENIGFSIPVNTLKPILQSFYEEGKIVRPYLGVSYSIVTRELSRIRDMPEGAFVSGVVPDSPAEKAGIIRGDIILNIGGEEINEDHPLSDIIQKRRVGDRVEVTIDRSGEQITLSLELEEAPASF